MRLRRHQATPSSAVIPTLAIPLLLATASAALHPVPAGAQGLKLAVGDVGLGIGDVPRIDGLRLNFRDRYMERVRGVNLTIWTPHEDPRGVVHGLAVGVPLTGAAEIRGLAVGAGIAAEREFSGVGIAPIGMGAGDRMRGIVIAGIGAGGGGTLDGLMVGGVGIGAGGAVRGIMIAGVGAGAGGSVEGIGIAGLGIGAGGRLTGLAVGGIGVGAPRITGVVLSGIGAGGVDVHGLVIAPGYMRIEDEGRLRGVSVSAFNDIRGEQRGLTIGLLNIAAELHGVQLGLINIARNKESFPLLPLVNYHP